MPSFLGEYDVSIDAKGRFLLPAGLRKQLPEGYGERFVINRGFEKCLVLYTMDVWDRLAANLSQLNELDPKQRTLKRLLLNGASGVELDSAGRMLLPKNHMEFAGLSKEMILAAQGNKVELWDKEVYQKYMQDNMGSLSQLAEEVGGAGLFNPFAS